MAAQDSNDQTAVLACFIDFQKAFMRINHNILVEKLSQLGVPGWLLRIIISFLKDRTMIVKYLGCSSSKKALPGGSPQGTLLALLLFIILVNDLGYQGQENNAGDIASSKNKLKIANEIHLKFVDDFTIAEAINMKKDIDQTTNSSKHLLDKTKSRVYEQLSQTVTYAETNEMKLNLRKTKLMLFNPCHSIELTPQFSILDNEIEVVSETRLLGLQISNNLKWNSNTHLMVSKATKRLWILRRLKVLGANQKALLDVYVKQVRCILEFGAPAWQGSITTAEKYDIERVQKIAVHIILGRKYNSYKDALQTLNLESLEDRRIRLCLKFALKAEVHPKFKHWFKEQHRPYNTRCKTKYKEPHAMHSRYAKSPIAYLTKLLNLHYNKK